MTRAMFSTCSCSRPTYLPHEDLFEALYGFHTGGLNIPVVLSNQGRAARQLRRALTYQQYDNRLEEYWLSLITIPVPYSHGGNLSSERETDLMDGWRGLLWIPPSQENQKTGNTISIERISQGLLAIHNTVKDTTQALAVLREALPQLDESYPRSPEFWRDQLGPVLPDWPELLRDIVAEHWPILSQEEGGVQIPQNAQPVWQLLTPQEREDIEDAASNANTEHWKLAWDKLFVCGCSEFGAPRKSGASGSIRSNRELRNRFLNWCLGTLLQRLRNTATKRLSIQILWNVKTLSIKRKAKG